MRKTPWLLAEPYRIQSGEYRSQYGDAYGAFLIPYPPSGAKLLVLASEGRQAQERLGDALAWDHVSVSTKNRTPNWYEMDFIKSIFWEDDETVIQLHVQRAQHVNVHPHTLHLWKPLLTDIPIPPVIAV